MKYEKTYLAILEQAFSPELAGLHAGAPGFAVIAETLANDLYRLCIEFGVSFNDFKARVLREALDHSRLQEKEDNCPITPLLMPARANLPILVYAFEYMPNDTELEAE